MNRRLISITIILILLIISLEPIGYGQIPLRDSRISSGEPMLTGNLGGRVMRSSQQLRDLVLVIDFGEISPINPNRLVKVSVPITITAQPPFQITASAIVANDGAVIRSTDIGFGIQNLRPTRTKSIMQNQYPVLADRFESDPAMAVRQKGRISFSSSLADIGYNTVLMQNQSTYRLTHRNRDHRNTRDQQSRMITAIEDSWTFDAIFAIAPQFFPPGQFNITVTFSVETEPTDLLKTF